MSNKKGRLLHLHFMKFFPGNPRNLIKALLVDKDLSFISAIRLGIDHEEKQQYTAQMQQSHQGFKCVPAGFVINPLYPHLGASPA